MELLYEARGAILKLLGGLLLLFYLVLTGIHMSNRLPIDRAIFGVNLDARIIFNCPTNPSRIWEIVNRSRDDDDILEYDGRFGKDHTKECG